MFKPLLHARQVSAMAALAAVLALLIVPGAHGDVYYTDQAGDSGSAPDIADVSVVDDAAGNITLTVSTNQAALAPDASIAVFVDSDRNPATGMKLRGLGVDHYFSYGGGLGLPFLVHVSGNHLIIDLNATLTMSYRGGLTARINASDLGDTKRFRLLIRADQEDADGETIASDFAPDGASFLEYALATPLVLTVGRPVGAGQPRAGKSFVVVAPATRSDGEQFASGKVVCKARAGAVPIASSGRAANGSARCTMRIPTGTTGRMLRGTLTVSVAGTAPVTKPFVYRIR